MNSYGILAISIVFNMVGNHLFKFASRHLGSGFLNKDFLVLGFAGFIFYSIAAVLYILSLRNLPLSVAYPMLSITYAITVFTSYYLFEESITASKLVGVALILIGVVFINKKIF
jgi:multidrug transporter EmrE-like cation transporter